MTSLGNSKLNEIKYNEYGYYCEFPNGLLIQWGRGKCYEYQRYPIPFTTAVRLSAANWLILSFLTVLATACSISYKFNGASIDYTKVKTITIRDFTNQAPYVMTTVKNNTDNQLVIKYII